ncbi:MAG: CaiB/BaiF CoA-transferase family protein [Aquabacterium sp.]|nr:CaiB/BaiF CoA-transferase family protein [Aquabacterium sp.]
MTAPLQGIRIVDLSAVFSGPMATALLGDQGAEVIKVESPEGDTTRFIGPAKGDLAASYVAANRGKRNLALDLKSPDAIAVLHRLLARADVLVENFRPGVMARLGLADADLAARYPGLIRVSITGFGPDGPRGHDKAYDAVIQALGGLACSQRDPASGAPVIMASTVSDKVTALTAAQAITAALFARERNGGRGSRVEVAMLDATVAFQWPDAMYNHVWLDDPPAPFPEFGATQRPWRTADGWVATMVPQQAEFQGLCNALGHPEITQDPRFASQVARYRHGPEVRAVLEPLFAQTDTATLEQRCREEGAALGRINERADLLADPQVLHNGCAVVVTNGDGDRVRVARSAARFDGQAQVPTQGAARLGEHSTAVLQDLGLDDARIAALVASGAVRLPRAG